VPGYAAYHRLERDCAEGLFADVLRTMEWLGDVGPAETLAGVMARLAALSLEEQLRTEFSNDEQRQQQAAAEEKAVQAVQAVQADAVRLDLVPAAEGAQ
jgi:hypothetical protein